MRKTKKPTLAPAIEKAWAAVFAECAVEDAAALEKAGWKHAYEIAEAAGRNYQFVKKALDASAEAGKFEKKYTKVLLKGRVQSVNFYRPK